MRTLNAYERDPRVINGSIRDIQKVVDTTTSGESVVRLPDGTAVLSLGDVTSIGPAATPLALRLSDAAITGFDGWVDTYFYDAGTADWSTVIFRAAPAGQGGPYILIDNASGSPAAGDAVAGLAAYGRDDGGNLTNYGALEWLLLDPTDGSENSNAQLKVFLDGASTIAAVFAESDPYSQGFGTTHTMNFGTPDYGALWLKSTSPGAVGPGLVTEQASASPTVGDACGYWDAAGRNDAGEITYYGALDMVIVDATNGSEDGRVRIGALIAGTGTTIATFGPGTVIGNPTGGDKGVGTLNATAVYDDNVLLTCYGLGDDIDQDFFNAQAPDGEHGPLNAFLAKLGTEYDPTTLAGQRKHVTDKKHLTPYPNPAKYTERMRPSVGGWVQSGVEMDELLFRYICDLEDRIERLENAAV